MELLLLEDGLLHASFSIAADCYLPTLSTEGTDSVEYSLSKGVDVDTGGALLKVSAGVYGNCEDPVRKGC